MKQILIAVAGMVVVSSMPNASYAQETGDEPSWGCQILLCAASSNPSWHGVPYCIPPMTKLITAMAKPGFSWPICHEAKSGKPGHQPYEDCPSGFAPAGSIDSHGSVAAGRCSKTMNTCAGNRKKQELDLARYKVVQYQSVGGSHHDDSCRIKVSIARPLRTNPYFFDIPDYQGVKGRFWFNLKL